MDIQCLKKETKSEISVCRLCISFTECAHSINYLRLFLDDVLPKLDLTLSSNPVVCINCANSLTDSFNFKKLCIETERRIREYYNKTKNTVNLCAMVEEGQQTSETISNLSNNDLANNIDSAIIAGDTIKVEELDLPFIEEQPSIESDVPENIFKPISVQKNNNYYKSIFIKKEQSTLKLEESKENMICKNFNKTKEDPEIDTKLGTVNKITFKECEELVDSNYYNNMSNIVEIVESDIVSDIDTSEDEDFTIFKEFCCKRKDNSESNNTLKSSPSMLASGEVIPNIEKIKLIGSDSESRDSDIIFVENCDNQNASNVTSKYKCATGVEIVTEEVNASVPNKSLQSDILSKSINSQAACQNKNKRNSALFNCVLCTTTFSTKIQVDEHLLTKHNNVPDIKKQVKSKIHCCKHCSYRTVLNSNLTTHVVRKHNPPDNVLWPVNALSSDNGLLSKKAAKIKIPHKLYKKKYNDLFECVLCSKTFAQKLNLDGHLLSKHKDISDIEKRVTSKIHFCHYCSYRTINNYNLAKHLVSKHNKISTQYRLKFKTFSCEHCEYSTENQGNLKMHTRTHSSVKEFQCYFCEKSFHQKGNLNQHFLRYHASAMNVGKSEKKSEEIFKN